MPLITLSEILKTAEEKQYGVGAFNVDCYDALEGVMAAAEKRKVPVIINVAEVHYEAAGKEQFIPYVFSRVSRSPIPVVINLDHGFSYESAIKAIHYGYSSVMIDGSELPYDENVRQTKEIVKVAHTAGVSVEAELGRVVGLEGKLGAEVAADRDSFTDPDEAVKFVAETGIDALAVSVGTVHGVFKGDPEIDFELLQALYEKIDVPLVLHGGSGLSADDFKKAIRCGIRKINVYTTLYKAALDEIKTLLADEKHNGTFADLVHAARSRIEIEAGKHMDIFGTMP